MRSCSGALLFLGLLSAVPAATVRATPPAIDQYGDPLPPGALARIGTSRLRQDSKARLWDVATGKEVRVFAGHTSRVSAIHLCPDGKLLATGSWDNSVRLWDVATAKELDQFPNLGSSVGSVHFSPDGRTLVAGT